MMKSLPYRRSVVLCPKIQMPAAVEVEDPLCIEACSRSPSLDCNRDCLSQLRFSAEELEDFLSSHAHEWCSSCGTILTCEDWYASRLVVACGADRHTMNEGLSQAEGERRQRICWNCYQSCV